MSEKRRMSSVDKTSEVDKEIDDLAEELEVPRLDLLEAIDYAKTMTDAEVEEKIDYVLNEYENDLNFPRGVIEAARRYRLDEELKNDPAEYQKIYKELRAEAALLAENSNSPYPEVRAMVNNYDDPTIPASTFRAWFIGIILVAAGASINQYFSIRSPGVDVAPEVAQLLAFPAGKLLEAILPEKQFTTFGYTWSLNPGRFNFKEHTVITIMATAGYALPLYTSLIWVQYLPLYFNQSYASSFGYQILLALSTNFVGYGLTGLVRRFLVYPSWAIWPANLGVIAINRAFHAETDTNDVVNGWAISRMRWFAYCFAAMFVYFWFPNYIIQAMLCFNWITWIAPKNIKLAAVTGSVTGLGLNPVPTFDWGQLTVAVDPIITPLFSVVNLFLGTLFALPIVAAVWFTNTWYTSYFPITGGVYDNTGNPYRVRNVVNVKALFNEAAYKAYSPAYLPASTPLAYGAFFAIYASLITHTALYHRREFVSAFKHLIGRESASANSKDIHTRLMKPYKEVPEWVFLIVLCASIGIGAAGIAVYPTNTSPAVVLYGVFLAIIFCIPCGIIMAVADVTITLNVIAELFGGLWSPGNAIAMNYFKVYGFATTMRTLNFAQNLKLAHYAHIAPWITFSSQMFATLVSTFVYTALLNYQMTKIPDVCTTQQKDHFTCPPVNSFFTASVLWGTLGPKKMFGAGAIYNGLLWCFFFGAFLPIPFYFLGKKWRIFQQFYAPVFLYGGVMWSVGDNLANIWPTVPVAWFFNHYIKKRFPGWWEKYSYITSTAFSCAIVIAAIVLFFALQKHNIAINWSGNDLPINGCDGNGCALYPVPGTHFGPGPGEF